MNKTKLFTRANLIDLFNDYEFWLSHNDVDIISTAFSYSTYIIALIVTYKHK